MIDNAVELNEVTKVFPGARGSTKVVTAVNQVSLKIQQGEFFTLLGPSGCGKTTTLRLIAGFESPTSGEIYLQGNLMTKIPPYRRPVNTVFQNYALFPHMNVADNVAYGLVVKRIKRAERDQRVSEVLELVRLTGMEKRRSSELSGGEQQRVALARALVNRPAVLLLDEPLGALDLKLRKAMQIELKHLQLQVRITFIYVTHDQEEALTMSDRIAVMNQGEVLQVDDPFTIYEKPINHFVAGFIGETNLLEGIVEAVTPEMVVVGIDKEQVSIQTNGPLFVISQKVTLAIRPEKVMLAGLTGNAQTGLKGTIQEVVYIGIDTRYVIRLSSGKTLEARIRNTEHQGWGEFKIGEPVVVSWLPEEARILTTNRNG
jgi:spermidine/putrescine transport system ATP-binding protein